MFVAEKNNTCDSICSIVFAAKINELLMQTSCAVHVYFRSLLLLAYLLNVYCDDNLRTTHIRCIQVLRRLVYKCLHT